MPKSDKSIQKNYEGLVSLVRLLRSPQGCPWDRDQTSESLKPLFLEECYEVVEAIEEQDRSKIIEELGDVLFHIVLQVHMLGEDDIANNNEVLSKTISKYVRRHPHVFEENTDKDVKAVEVQWDEIKRQEKANAEKSVVDGIPKQLPALAYAQAIQMRVAKVGFDWDIYKEVREKVMEELTEIEHAKTQSDREDELGDLLFSLVNTARWMHLDAETALRKANNRFFHRFTTMQELNAENDTDFANLSVEEKDSLWNRSKTLVD